MMSHDDYDLSLYDFFELAFRCGDDTPFVVPGDGPVGGAGPVVARDGDESEPEGIAGYTEEEILAGLELVNEHIDDVYEGEPVERVGCPGSDEDEETET